ncbi:MAG: spermidine/putrescine ABC transporter substrate-binding protein [Clostridiales bacterium]|jgi:spermidine/putrescine transport system substrate-binding protein|nr:spermidine/putrescine ABC transporter substrate-binding protein [Clostridiales bacterium]
MKKVLSLALAAIVAASLFGCASPQETLVIYTWAEYVPSEVVADFERDTGIKVVYATFSTNEEMLAAFEQKTDQYDVILCSDYIIRQMIEAGGLLKELDTERIANYGNIDPFYQSKHFDPDNKYTIPYAFSSALLVYDSARVDFPVTKYADLWDESFEGSIVLLDGARDILGLTLMMMGESINETDPEILEQVRQKLLELKPNVVAFNADTPHESLIRGDAKAGYMFASQYVAAKEAVPTIECAFAEEGISSNLDCFVVSAEAPNEDNAYTFLNYVLDGEVSAKMSSITNYANCNTAAKPFLPQEFLDNPSINVPPEAAAKAQDYLPLEDGGIAYDIIWTEFKAAN